MSNLLEKKDLNAEQLSMVQSEFDEKKKTSGIMFLLWWFTGGIGGHRYYLGDIGYAIGMTLTLGGLGVWTIIDVFFISKRLNEKNKQAERGIIQNVKAYTKAQ